MTVKPNPKEYYVFPEGNTIPYGQDFAFPRGIPAGVIFEKEDFTNDRCRLIAPGYGKKDNYGNGAIYVNIKELKPEYEFTPKESGANYELIKNRRAIKRALKNKKITKLTTETKGDIK